MANEMLGLLFFLIYLVIIIVLIASYWKVFVKAGQPGWAAIIPIYNLYIFLKIVCRPVWWLILFIIPVVDIIVYIIVSIDIAKRFNKEIGFAIGLILLPIIFYPILGFGDATYTQCE
jgi:hypothetical protein